MTSTLGFWERNYGMSATQMAGEFSATTNPHAAIAEVEALARNDPWRARYGIDLDLDVSSAAITGRGPGTWRISLTWSAGHVTVVTYDAWCEAQHSHTLRGTVAGALVNLGTKIDHSVDTATLSLPETQQVRNCVAKFRTWGWGGLTAGLLTPKSSTRRHAYVGRKVRCLRDPTIVVILHDQQRRGDCEEGLIANAVLREFKRKGLGCVVTTLPRPVVVPVPHAPTEQARRWLATARMQAGASMIGVPEAHVMSHESMHDVFAHAPNNYLRHYLRHYKHASDEYVVVMRTQVRGAVLYERVLVSPSSGRAMLLDGLNPLIYDTEMPWSLPSEYPYSIAQDQWTSWRNPYRP